MSPPSPSNAQILRPDQTKVTIIGAGVAGLSLALFLHGSGIDCVVLEKYERPKLEARHRAGFLDGEAVKIFQEWGALDKLPPRLGLDGFEVRFDGKVYSMPPSADGDETEGRFAERGGSIALETNHAE